MIKNCRLCRHYVKLQGEVHRIGKYTFNLHCFYCKKWNDTYHFYNPCWDFEQKKSRHV